MGNYNPKQPIVIFDGGRDGYGDAIKHPDRSSYNWAYNWDCTEEGRAVPAIAPIKIAPTTFTNLGRISCAFAWEDITTGRPLVLAGLGLGGTAATYLLRDGSYDVEGTDSSSSAIISGGVLWRYDDKGGSADEPDTEMAYFTRATGVSATAALWQRDKSASYNDTGHTISPYGIYVVGSQLWIVSANGYEVQKWSLDTDPGLSGSYGTAIPVGRPTYPVTHIGNLGGSPFVIKGDAAFKYDPSAATAEFISTLTFSSPHKENGRGTATDGRSRLYIPSVEGHLVVVTPGFQSLQTPARNRLIDRDTPYGRITAMACDLENVYAAIAPGQINTTQIGMTVVLNDVGVSQTDVTANVTDGKFATVADCSALGGTDWILVGADEPFLGVEMRFNTVGTGGLATSTPTIAYTSAATTFTTASGGYDGTGGLAKDGVVTVQNATSDNLLTTGTPWVKTTAYAGSSSKYWMKLTYSGGASMQAKIAEMRIIPFRPPLDDAVMPETAYCIGGAFPRILVGHWHGEDIVWNHVWTLNASTIEQMVVASGECGAVTSKRALYCFDASLNVHVIPIGPDAGPARAPWPKLADYSESGVAADTHAIGFSGIDFGQVVRFKDGLEIDMTAVQSDDAVRVYCRWDEDEVRGYQKIGESLHGHKFFKTAPPLGEGRILYTYLQYTDGSRTAMAPVLHSVVIPAGAVEPTNAQVLATENYPSPAQT